MDLSENKKNLILTLNQKNYSFSTKNHLLNLIDIKQKNNTLIIINLMHMLIDTDYNEIIIKYVIDEYIKFVEYFIEKNYELDKLNKLIDDYMSSTEQILKKKYSNSNFYINRNNYLIKIMNN